MLNKFKKRLYFVVAAYFGFWAKIVLKRWHPRIVVITGSSGKTTLLHLVEAQLGDQAVISHHANSAIGIPFHILGLGSNIEHRSQWLSHAIVAPFMIFRKLPEARIYIVEADCDRPHEGEFSAKLLKPEVTLWVSVYNTHSMNFDPLVKSGQFANHEAAIASEFGNFVTYSTKLVIANGDQPEVVKQLDRASKNVVVMQVHKQALAEYTIKAEETVFSFGMRTIYLPGIFPRDIGLSLQMVEELVNYLGLEFDPLYGGLQIPPGRSNVLKGQFGITIIDSTYNNGLGAMTAVLDLFSAYPGEHKWLVAADILEQGSLDKQEHKLLAEVIAKQSFDRVVLLGKRTKQFTHPILAHKLSENELASFETAGEVLEYLKKELKGGETILFKGAQGLEGVIEDLLLNPEDADRLVRRGQAWTKRRQTWGLPK